MRKADRTASGIIFNIQKFSVNDGPGIRTVVFFKGCPLRCHWCSNPESQGHSPRLVRHSEKCLSCGHCEAVCPADAVTLSSVFPEKCNLCGQCVRECPGRSLEILGERKTVQQVLDTVMQDVPFYEESGGGITLSGGEFLAQPAFAEELLLASREEGLHTCCETTGYAPPEVFERLISRVDYVLMDIKHYDAAKHNAGTGVSNSLALANMKSAIASGKPLLPRIPVIPGFNDSPADAAGFAQALSALGAKRCQLLPFHQFGESKYSLCGLEYAYSGADALHKEDLEDYLAILRSEGIGAFF